MASFSYRHADIFGNSNHDIYFSWTQKHFRNVLHSTIWIHRKSIFIISKNSKSECEKNRFFHIRIFSPVAVSGGCNLNRGYFTIFSTFHFCPSPIRVPHTAHTQKSHFSLSSPHPPSPLTSHSPYHTPKSKSVSPIHTPLNPKTTQFRYKSQPQYIKPKTNPNPNTIKNTLKLTQTILLANPKQLKTSPIHPPKTPHHTRCQTSPLTNM